MRTWLTHPWVALPTLVVLVFGLLAGLRAGGQLQPAELAAYDLMVGTARRSSARPPPIVLVEIGESDVQRLGNWPLTDRQLAEILRRLLAGEPRVIGVDLYRDLPVPPGSTELNALWRNEPRLIAIEKFPSPGSPGIGPPPVLAGSERVGFSDTLPDPDGVVRRNLLFLANDTRMGYSLSLLLALNYLAKEGIHPQPGTRNPNFLRLGDVTLAPLDGNEGGYVGIDAAGYQILLDYLDGPHPFRRVGLGQVLDGTLPPGLLRDRILILGAGLASEGVKDRFISPFALVQGARGVISGIELHAHASRQLLEAALAGRHPTTWWNDQDEILWLLLWILLGALGGWYAGSAARLALITLTGATLLYLAARVAFQHGLWIPLVPPLLGWLIAAALGTAYLASRRRRDQRLLMDLFGRHVAPQVARTIWAHREELVEDGRLVPQVLPVTVLFADLQGFTQVSEQLAPEPFLRWLNEFMSVMTEIVMQHGGVLDDYAGDGIKANFGVPVPRTDLDATAADARRAADCALAMGRALERLNRAWHLRGRPQAAMRIGIHSGQVVVGTVGSRHRMKYTTVGNQVNLASRLEGLRTAATPGSADLPRCWRILVSEATARLLGDGFSLRDLGQFRLRGIHEPIEVFSVDGGPANHKREAPDLVQFPDPDQPAGQHAAGVDGGPSRGSATDNDR